MADVQMKQELIPVRTRDIVEGDFRKSYETMFDEWQVENPRVRLGPLDAVLFHSTQWTMMCWVYRPNAVVTRAHGGVETESLKAVYFRLRRGTIHPWMLQNYAESVGLDMSLPRFEKYYDRNRREHRDAAAAAE